jgi:hypothetical protein
MRHLLSVVIIGSSLILAAIALAQSSTAPTAPAQSSTEPAAPAPAPASTSAPAVPVPSGKRFACKSASQAMKGQEQRDQMQLCMMQARIDCLKQAIDQKIVGPQRRDFLQTCAE